jgi:hypothetical protein
MVDLPDPDSPTNETTSPFSSLKLTFFTASVKVLLNIPEL